jgi:hypothetical protein
MPASAARYLTERPRNARFSRAAMRMAGAVGGEVVLAAGLSPRGRDYRSTGSSCSAEHHQLVRPSTAAVCIGA